MTNKNHPPHTITLPNGFKMVKKKCGCMDTENCDHENVTLSIDDDGKTVYVCGDCGKYSTVKK